MDKKSSIRIPISSASNPKSKIENLKWLGLSVIALVLVVTGAVAEAQQPKKVPRIGYLSASDPASESARAEAIRLALRELGYIEGQNIAIEYRYAEGKPDRFLSLRPSWCVSRLISSWQQEGPGWSGRPRMRPRRFPSLWWAWGRSCRGRPS